MRAARKIPLALSLLSLALAGCGGDDGGGDAAAKTPTGSGSSSSKQAPAVSEETIAGWPAKFCSLKPQMTRAQIQKVMGTPTNADQEALNADQDVWMGGAVSLVAFYEDGKAWQLQDSSGTSKLPCEKIRSGF